MVRRRFDDDGRFYNVHGIYPDLVRLVAAETQAPLIDMHALSEELLVEYRAEQSNLLFLWLEPGETTNYPDGLGDNTHFSPMGARVMAELDVAGLRQSGLELAKHIRR